MKLYLELDVPDNRTINDYIVLYKNIESEEFETLQYSIIKPYDIEEVYDYLPHDRGITIKGRKLLNV